MKLRGKFLLLGTSIVIMSLFIGYYLLPKEKIESKGYLQHNLTVSFGNRVESRIVALPNGSTVFDLLNKSYSMKYKEYGNMGKMILAIDGVEQNSTHSWIYYVNGKFADRASDKYPLIQDSKVEWYFMKNEDIMSIFS